MILIETIASINDALLTSIDKTRLEQHQMEVELFDKLHSCEPLPDIEEFLATKDTFIKKRTLEKNEYGHF